MSYGIKVINPLNDKEFAVLTPKVATAISVGRVTMSDSLNADNTYGTDIDLPGDAEIDESNIGVIVYPVDSTYTITSIEFDIAGEGTYIQNVGYMNSAATYYKHSKATGIMTSWVAGNLTDGNPLTFDHIVGMFPVAFWDKMSKTRFTSIRLFAAMCYLVYDSSEAEYIKVYSIGSNGVSHIDYVVTIRNTDY